MMRTLRGKIFVFTLLLLILPALPLSYFVQKLLDNSYRIGVNERVETALDNALEISSDLYQTHKLHLQNILEKHLQPAQLSNAQIAALIKKELPGADITLPAPEAESAEKRIDASARRNFRQSKKLFEIWPSIDHKNLFALAALNKGRLLEIVYPLPQSFQNGARHIQEVNQIYKTLNFARDELQKSFLYTFLIIYLISIAIAFGISYFISSRITRPIDVLTQAAEEIGKGRLDYRIPVSSNDEFGVLAKAFNKMVSELQENQQQILNLEKMAAWQQLARRLAHEIKNPLTPIQLMAQQMRDNYSGDDTDHRKMLAECSSIIEEEVGSLKKLVREFSDFARLPEFQPVKQDLCSLLESVQKLYGNEKVVLEKPAEPLLFSFDYDYMKRVLINLVDNALAASGNGKQVLLRLSAADNSKIELSVIDQGEGISADSLQKIFEPYFSTKRSGAGLGLAIVKKIIQEHNGTIKAESVLGEGTQFIIKLPFDKNIPLS